MRIVDLINNTPAKTDYLISTLLPRVADYNPAIGLTALDLLGAIVKNCPSSHALVGKREVLESIVTILPEDIRRPDLAPSPHPARHRPRAGRGAAGGAQRAHPRHPPAVGEDVRLQPQVPRLPRRVQGDAALRCALP